MRFPPADEHHPQTASIPYFPFDENVLPGAGADWAAYLY